MSKNWMGVCTVIGLTAVAAMRCGAADGAWKSPSTGAWSDSGKWVDGVIAGSGGVATFQGSSGYYEITNDMGTVVLSGFRSNPDSTPGSIAADWRLVGGIFELISPALLDTTAHGINLRRTTLTGSADVTITGPGRTFLGDDNLFTGRTIVSNGNARVARDSGFGPVPDICKPDAIILDNGGLQNDDGNYALVIHANRGITLSPRGGFLGAGYVGGATQVDSPITGSGTLGINYEFSSVILNNSARLQRGTVVGTNGLGASLGLGSLLRLGQDGAAARRARAVCRSIHGLVTMTSCRLRRWT